MTETVRVVVIVVRAVEHESSELMSVGSAGGGIAGYDSTCTESGTGTESEVVSF